MDFCATRAPRCISPLSKVASHAWRLFTLNSGSLSTPDRRPLIDGLTLSVGTRKGSGLVGPMAVGKSTLLKTSIRGERCRPASGTVHRAGSCGAGWCQDRQMKTLSEPRLSGCGRRLAAWSGWRRGGALLRMAAGRTGRFGSGGLCTQSAGRDGPAAAWTCARACAA